MSKAMITQARLKELLYYDPVDGLFIRRKPGAYPFGIKGKGRVTIHIEGAAYSASRLAWLYMNGEFPTGLVDHINGDPHDNRWCNLREVTRSGNAQNQHRGQRPGKLLGAHFHKRSKRWFAQIKVNDRSQWLGFYESEQAAHEAYVTAKRVLHATNTL